MCIRDRGEHYKAEIIASIPSAEPISLYAEGAFTDLCRGPHVPSTGRLKVFKLTKLAGAYWRGDSRNEMLQRIYGTAWAKKEDLDAYLHRIEEAEKRDHRRIGRQLDLFHPVSYTHLDVYKKQARSVAGAEPGSTLRHSTSRAR